ADRAVGAGSSSGRLEPRLRGGGDVGIAVACPLRGLHGRLVLGRARDRRVPRVLPGCLRSRASHPPVRLPLVALLVHGPSRRRGERTRRRAVGVRRVLRPHVPRLPARSLPRPPRRVLAPDPERGPACGMSVGPGDLLALGFEGTALPDEIVDLAAEAGLGGVVLFARNCPSLDAVLTLTAAARALGPDVLVLVDHEGGRVHRLPGPFPRCPPPRTIRATRGHRPPRTG